jgi:hypothetical protein
MIELTTLVEPRVVIEHDYDGAFEHLVRRWMAKKVGPFKHTEIRINAGPYRESAVSYVSKDDVLWFDFYSALRAGFGDLSAEDVEALIDLL